MRWFQSSLIQSYGFGGRNLKGDSPNAAFGRNQRGIPDSKFQISLDGSPALLSCTVLLPTTADGPGLESRLLPVPKVLLHSVPDRLKPGLQLAGEFPRHAHGTKNRRTEAVTH